MKYCHKCGMQLKDDEEFCPNCGAKRKTDEDSETTTSSVDIVDNTDTNVSKKSKLIVLLLWFFLGVFGVHNFYTGDNNRAVKELICSLLAFLIVPAVIFVVLWIQDLLRLLNDKCLDEEGRVISSWNVK